MGEEEALRDANKLRDQALEKLATENVTTSEDRAGDDSSIEMGRRVTETPSGRRDTTGLDLGDSMFGDLDDSFGDEEISKALRSVDSSSLSMSNFRARSRSRQSTIIGRHDSAIRPTSRGTNTPGMSTSFSIGMFRRRAREPSILSTARKPRSNASNAPSIGAPSDLESEAEGDFLPEAESTPLEKRKSRTAVDENGSPSPKMGTRRSTRASLKRKSEEGAAASDRPEKASRTSQSEPVDISSDSESDLSSLDSPQRTSPTAMPARPVTPVNLSDSVLAPPMSSGSEDDGDMWPDIRGLAKRRRRPSDARVDDLSDMSSPPSLTHSPNYNDRPIKKTRGRSRTRQKSPSLTTADLATLLPKRKYKKQRDALDSDEELDNADLEGDEDELTHLDTRTSRRRKAPSRAASAASMSRSRGGKALQQTEKNQGRRTTRSASQKATYSRKSSDKENESGDEEEVDESMFQALPEDTFDQVGPTGFVEMPEELKKATEKFKEVDQWNLEYEEVQPTSSPAGAR